jgi:putative DNA primase/helicase
MAMRCISRSSPAGLQAEPLEWLSFLARLWPDDAQSIDALQEIFGYVLTSDTSQQKAFLIVGPPRSGKGTRIP